jgi:hypothetical protein
MLRKLQNACASIRRMDAKYADLNSKGSTNAPLFSNYAGSPQDTAITTLLQSIDKYLTLQTGDPIPYPPPAPAGTA